MKASELRDRFIKFFVEKHGHAAIPGASLIPENDPTVLFTTAGMHPLVPYLMGEQHPEGKRLVDVQKCVRTDDIDEVGDATHCTFFEMLGNWSLGDYFKKEAIHMSYEFLTSSLKEGGLGLDPDRLAVSCFGGDADAPRDEEAAQVWEGLGFVRAENAKPDQKRRIFFYGKKENWWGPAGLTGPCGPDTEMFYYNCDDMDTQWDTQPSDSVTPWVEIWNDVFMEFFKTEAGTYEPLKQKNVDTGMGLERVSAILQGKKTHYETELFAPVILRVRELAKNSDEESERVIADHLRAATFIIGDERGVNPSNKDQGYVLRSLIRRAIRKGRKIGIEGNFTAQLAEIFIEDYGNFYKELLKNKSRILEALVKEEEQFQKTLTKAEGEVAKDISKGKIKDKLTGEQAFYYFETFGLPIEMIVELMKDFGISVDTEAYQKAYEAHQEKSRAGAEQKFAGGLADHSMESKKLHTATHLMLEALRRVLGKHVEQRGSNITQERLRFDFNFDRKMTPEEIAEVEKIVNDAIQADYPVSWKEMSVQEARDLDATGIFVDKYEGELDGKVKVYFMGDYSKEICGGPHVDHTGQLGKTFKIAKEESSSSGVRRIKAVLT